ncbi:DNA-3-methyladenine glycosylase family protein [Actinophytocola sp.]|uniref:DNA-3-methyladenine glycosylase family protein n=1 Tax=Actinophytocola sp. TaxID=1872138 RepID=UPI003D6A4BE5
MWHDIPYRGPFDLTASTRFLEGFAPAARPDAAASAGELRLAFPAAPSWRPAGVLVRQPARDGPVRARVFADASDADAVLDQVRRMLSLDVDGSGFAAVGERDPVVAELRRCYPGLRPVTFHSPYEAACWAIISHRIRVVHAAGIRQRLAERFGTPVDVAGVRLPTFPAPDALPERVALVSELKSDRLHAVAQAALAGRLDAAALRALPLDDAIARLRELPGIGPFSAELILLRGAGHPDGFPTAEARLHDEMAHAYGLSEPTVADLARVADAWRPYRTWVSLLLRTRREEETAEIATGRRVHR